MDPLLSLMSFLSVGLVVVFSVLYFAGPKETEVSSRMELNRHFQSRYIVGPEIF
ncbi:MAG: hypothetical protein VX695_01650 [Chloroflexota bacterium]|nr:hypothetical protein [Chloroflexota bacterium]